MLNVAGIIKLDNLADTIALAALAHRDQVDLNGDPYILHPMRVLDNVRELGGDEAAQQVAILHDVVEDTDVTMTYLMRLGLPPAVAKSLEAITHLPNEPYLEYVERAAKDPIARLVKIADVQDNANLERLGRLPDSKRERLIKKYAEALGILGVESWLPVMV